MRELLTILACTGILSYGNAQTVSNLDTAGLRSGSAIYNKFIAGDSLCSSFCIVIKTSVRPHRHEFHSEQVLVLEGSALMKMAGKEFAIKKNDLIFIPKGTVHSVKNTGKDPLRILSVQSPYFDGKDRVMVEE